MNILIFIYCYFHQFHDQHLIISMIITSTIINSVILSALLVLSVSFIITCQSFYRYNVIIITEHFYQEVPLVLLISIIICLIPLSSLPPTIITVIFVNIIISTCQLFSFNYCLPILFSFLYFHYTFIFYYCQLLIVTVYMTSAQFSILCLAI